MMHLVYIAGPFTAPTREGVELNIQRAVDVGLDVAALGAFPVIPHSMTAHPDFEKVQDYPFWIDGTTELLRRCDVCLMVPGWESSRGATGERAVADLLRMPRFDAFGDFRDWFKGRGSVRPGVTQW